MYSAPISEKSWLTYLNGTKQSITASGGGTIFAGYVDMATYSRFSNCMQTFAACDNIFYSKDGVVTQYSPIGSGAPGAPLVTAHSKARGCK
jgi:hypothetical protein